MHAGPVHYLYSVAMMAGSFVRPLFCVVFFRTCMRCQVWVPLIRFRTKFVRTEVPVTLYPLTWRRWRRNEEEMGGYDGAQEAKDEGRSVRREDTVWAVTHRKEG